MEPNQEPEGNTVNDSDLVDYHDAHPHVDIEDWQPKQEPLYSRVIGWLGVVGVALLVIMIAMLAAAVGRWLIR